MSSNQQQAEAWNGPEATHFLEHADRYDGQFRPLTDALLGAVPFAPHHSVLDVGCGTGATALTVARRVHSVLGVDISIPLLDVAAARADAAAIANAEFLAADAQVHPFVERSVDVIISQLGVMFFGDPVAAFANLRSALVPDGLLAFVCWQGLEDNEWIRVVGDAVAARTELPALGGRSGGPGMFALKEADEVTDLLRAAGFAGISVERIAPTILVGGGGTLDASTDFLLGMGMVRGLLGRLEGDDRDAAMASVRATMAEHHLPGVGVTLGSGAWVVTARR